MNCPLCDSPASLLGMLGQLAHFICRNCGAQFSKEYENETTLSDS